MQLLCHLPLINVKLPGNATLFTNTLMAYVRFDVIKADTVRKAMGLEWNLTTFENFEQAGYGSKYSVINISTIFFMIICLVILLLVVALFHCFGKKYKNVKSISDWLYQVTFWQVPVRLFMLILLPLSISCVQNMMFLEGDFPSVFAIAGIVIIALITLLTILLQFCMCRSIGTKRKRNMSGWLTSVAYIRNADPRAFQFLTLFILRRVLFALVCNLMPKFYSGQAFVVLICSLWMMIILHKFCPFGPQDVWLNYVAFINELFVFFGVMNFIPMSNLVRDVDQLWAVGRTFMCLITACIVFNLINLTVMMIQDVKTWALTRQLKDS